jgi:hypothetical protein
MTKTNKNNEICFVVLWYLLSALHKSQATMSTTYQHKFYQINRLKQKKKKQKKKKNVRKIKKLNK